MIKFERILRFLLLSMLLIFPSNGQGLPSEAGFPSIKNYTPKEYGAHTQNWAIAQDDRGVMYIGNTAGVLEYDGVSWRLISLLGKSRVVFSLAIDENGTIYVGSFNELGYLSPDSTGQLQYISLVNHLPEQYRQVANVWRIFATDSGVYFTTPKYILHWSNDRFHVWEAETGFRLSYYVNDRLYIVQENVGLMQLSNDSLKIIPVSKRFLKAGISAILTYDEKRSLFVTSRAGLYRFDGHTFEPLKVSSVFTEKPLYVGARLAPDRFVVSVVNDGILCFNKQGEIQFRLNKATGLQDNAVHDLYQDREGALWITLNNGISRVQFSSAQTFYDARHGLNGKIQRCLRKGKKLYVATNTGAFKLANRLSTQEKRHDTFIRIPGIDSACWDLITIDESLLIASDKGIYKVTDHRTNGKPVVSLISKYRAYDLVRSQQDSNRLFLALNSGLASFYKDAQNRGTWLDEAKLAGVDDRVRWLTEDSSGNLWLSTAYRGVLRVRFSKPKTLQNPVITRFDTANGLPSMNSIRVFGKQDRVCFGTESGVFIFDVSTQRFIEMQNLAKILTPKRRQVYRIAPSGKTDFWLVLAGEGHEAGKATYQPDGSYAWFGKPFLAHSDLQINEIYPEPDGVVWLGTSEGLIRHDTNVLKNYEMDYSALIRRVFLQPDSVIFAGEKTSQKLPVFEFSNNALRFEYAAAFFDGDGANRFQYFLDGFNNDWSDWTEETRKDYTNLHEGKYRFRVRAKNVYDHLSTEDVFAFEILPPWYRTAWAYIVTAVAFLILFVGGVKWRSRQLVREKEVLEKIVTERTEEVRSQAEKLKEMDRLKSRFFANVSHEFRTPLTLIIGPLKEMMAGQFKGDRKQQYGIMHRSASRVLSLINQLLDLSKMESGSMSLKAARSDVVFFMKGVVNAFMSLAESKRVQLQFTSTKSESELYFDRDKLEKIINNLLSNAFKFTSDGGRVTVAIRLGSGIKKTSDGDKWKFVEISIEDTGIGIPADRVTHVFDRFYQVDSSQTREHDGTGIGLALTKELVELHHGEILVRSREGEGTEFVIRLPLGKDHLKEAEIAEARDLQDFENVKGPALDEIVEPSAQPARESKPSPGFSEKTVILVVEDNVDVRNYIRQQLEPAYEVAEAQNGAEGVDIALNVIPDLIISDVMMPNMDGYELCGKLKQDVKTSHIPIILLTAKAEEHDKLEGLETGADDYLIKPFNSQELLARVKNLIEVRRKLQEKYRRDFLLEPGEVEAVSMEEDFLQRANHSVQEHLSEPEFHVEQLAQELYMSRVSLHRKLRALVDQSASEFIRSMRLKRAAQLLKQDAGNITEIAFKVGFSNSAYFTQCFHEQFGDPPSEYRKKTAT